MASGKVLGSGFDYWLDRREALRLIADGLPVPGDRGLQRRHCADFAGVCACQARLRLRNVGPGDFADREPVPGLAQLLLKHQNVVALQIEQRRVAQHVHVGGNSREQRILLGVAQLLARPQHLRFRLTDRVGGAHAVEDGLVGCDAVAPGTEINHRAAAGVSIGADQTRVGALDGADCPGR